VLVVYREVFPRSGKYDLAFMEAYKKADSMFMSEMKARKTTGGSTAASLLLVNNVITSSWAGTDSTGSFLFCFALLCFTLFVC